MIPVVFGLQVFVSRSTDRDDDPDRVSIDADVEAVFTCLDVFDGLLKTELPPGSVRVDATDGLDALMRTRTVGFVDAFDLDVICHN